MTNPPTVLLNLSTIALLLAACQPAVIPPTPTLSAKVLRRNSVASGFSFPLAAWGDCTLRRLPLI